VKLLLVTSVSKQGKKGEEFLLLWPVLVVTNIHKEKKGSPLVAGVKKTTRKKRKRLCSPCLW
jgi:hypothetical protein